jgi:hypothetical protein
MLVYSDVSSQAMSSVSRSSQIKKDGESGSRILRLVAFDLQEFGDRHERESRHGFVDQLILLLVSCAPCFRFGQYDSAFARLSGAKCQEHSE